MTRFAVPVGALLLLLSACAHAPPGSDPFTWNHEAEAGLLYYGEPDTDNVGLSLNCKPGSGGIEITEHRDAEHAADAAWQTRLDLRAGPVSRTYPARGLGTELGDVVIADATVDDPVLKVFAATGKVWVGRYPIPAETAGELAAIRAFFSTCAPN